MKPFAQLRFAAIALVGALLAGALHAAAPERPLQGKKVLFVIQLNGKSRATDDSIVKHLESRGIAVTLADQADPASKAGGQDLVLISATVSAKVTAGTYKDIALPVVTCESNVLGHMGMTGTKLDVDFGTIEKKDHYLSIVNAPHPLAAGLAAGTFVATEKNVQMNWGRPGPAANVIATPPGYPDKAVIFGYEKGATMAGDFSAPARRVSFFLYNDAFGVATPETHALLDAALGWALDEPVAKGAASGAKGKRLLLVLQAKSDHRKAEVREAVAKSNAQMVSHFRALGFEVSVADQVEPATKAAGKDLVVISSTVKANVLGDRYKNVSAPIVNFENDILDDLGMTAKRRGVDFGDIEDMRAVTVVNAPHPLAAGFPAGALDIFREGAGLGWGLPGTGAITIATIAGQPDKAAVFGYEKGATMDYDFAAPARRVFLPVDYNAWDKLGENGMKLVDAALVWALNSPATRDGAR